MSGDPSFAGYARGGSSAGMTRLDLNEAPREPADGFRSRMLELLAENAWRRYPDVDGRAAREAAAELYGWEAGGTLPGNGSNELLAAAFRTLLPIGGRVFAYAPSFSMYPVLAARRHARLVTLPLEPPDFSVPASKLLALAGACDLIVICSPNNPTGGETPDELFDRICSLGKPVIWDGAYLDFSAADAGVVLRRYNNLIVLRSLSKAWGLAGLRVGALLAAPELAAVVAGELLPYDTGWLILAALRAAVEMRRAGEELVAEVRAERARLLAALAALGGIEAVPSAGNFFLLRRPGLSGTRLREALGRRGIAVRDVADLDAHGYVRVTVGSRAENDLLLAAARGIEGDGDPAAEVRESDSTGPEGGRP